MIDRRLNYGRHQIERLLCNAPAVNTVVDLGAGHGDDLFLARKVNPQAALHAVEAYPPYAEDLRQKGVEVHPLDIERERLPFDDVTVDVVIMNQVLEHVKEVFWIFHEATRVLRVGGSFIIGVPNLAALHNRILLLVGRQPTPLKNWSAHVRGWTRNDLTRFFGECFPGGYVLRDFGGSAFYPFPPVLAKPLADMLPNMAWGIFMRWEKRSPYSAQFLEYPVEQRLETNFYLGKA